MKIGVLCPRYYPNIAGGGEISLKLLAEELAKSHEVWVFSFDGTGTETINGVQVKRFRDVVRLREIKNFYAFLRLMPELETFDILHSFNMKYHPATGLLGRCLGIRTIATMNDYTFLSPEVVGNPAKRGITRPYFLVSNHILNSCIKQIDQLVCTSPAVRQIYVHHGFSPSKITIIPQPVRIISQERDSRHRPIRALYVGRLESNKNVELLLRAFAYLPRKAAQLWIAGEGTQKAALEGVRSKLKLNTQVFFLGHLSYDQISELYAECDILVHPASEPFGRTIVEAIQAGLLVIAADAGGSTAILPAALLFAPTLPGLVKKLQEVLTQSEEYTSTMELVRININEQYSPEVVQKQYLEVYRQ